MFEPVNGTATMASCAPEALLGVSYKPIYSAYNIEKAWELATVVPIGIERTSQIPTSTPTK